MIKESDAHVASQLILDESRVWVREKQHKKDEDKDSHTLIRDYLPNVISLQY